MICKQVLEEYSITEEKTRGKCSKQGIIPLLLASHSSDQTQPLDIGILGIQKVRMNRMSVPSGLSNQSAQIIRILDCNDAQCEMILLNLFLNLLGFLGNLLNFIDAPRSIETNCHLTN